MSVRWPSCSPGEHILEPVTDSSNLYVTERAKNSSCMHEHACCRFQFMMPMQFFHHLCVDFWSPCYKLETAHSGFLCSRYWSYKTNNELSVMRGRILVLRFTGICNRGATFSSTCLKIWWAELQTSWGKSLNGLILEKHGEDLQPDDTFLLLFQFSPLELYCT